MRTRNIIIINEPIVLLLSNFQYVVKIYVKPYLMTIVSSFIRFFLQEACEKFSTKKEGRRRISVSIYSVSILARVQQLPVANRANHFTTITIKNINLLFDALANVFLAVLVRPIILILK